MVMVGHCVSTTVWTGSRFSPRFFPISENLSYHCLPQLLMLGGKCPPVFTLVELVRPPETILIWVNESRKLSSDQ